MVGAVVVWSVGLGLVLIGCTSGNIGLQVPLMTQVFACDGDRIPLMVAVQYAESHIESSKIYKNGDGIENRMVKIGNSSPVLTPPDKVQYISPTGIYLKNASVDDSGPYEIHAVFKDGATAWHRFNVTVFVGCPDKREFYDPSIRYRVDLGALEPLSDARFIELDDSYKMLTLNVSISKSNLPATCTITGRGRTITAEGAGDTAVYCLATFHNEGPDNYTVTVDLEHLILQSPSKTHIEVFVTAATGGPATGDLGEENSPSTLLWLLVLLPAIAGLVGGIFLCKRKQIGPFKPKRTRTTETGSPGDATGTAGSARIESGPNRSGQHQTPAELVAVSGTGSPDDARTAVTVPDESEPNGSGQDQTPAELVDGSGTGSPDDARTAVTVPDESIPNSCSQHQTTVEPVKGSETVDYDGKVVILHQNDK